MVGRLKRTGPGGPAVTIGVVVATASLAVVLCRNWAGVAEKVDFAGPLLLLVVYVLVAEANSQILGEDTAAWWLRIYVPAVLAAVVLLPLLNADFAAYSVWPLAITVVLVMLASAAASPFTRRFD